MTDPHTAHPRSLTEHARTRTRARQVLDAAPTAPAPFARQQERDAAGPIVRAAIRRLPGCTHRQLEAATRGTVRQVDLRTAVQELIADGVVETRPGPSRSKLHFVVEAPGPVSPAALALDPQKPAQPPTQPQEPAQDAAEGQTPAARTRDTQAPPQPAEPRVGHCPACGRWSTASHLARAGEERMERLARVIAEAHEDAVEEAMYGTQQARTPSWDRPF